MIRRREFISVLGGAAAAWPMGARAQSQKVPTIGCLHAAAPESAATTLPALRKGQSETGFVEGGNVSIDYLYGSNNYDWLQELRRSRAPPGGGNRRIWRRGGACG